MSRPEVLALALLPACLLLDVLNPPPLGVRARWWRNRAFVVTARHLLAGVLSGPGLGRVDG